MLALLAVAQLGYAQQLDVYGTASQAGVWLAGPDARLAYEAAPAAPEEPSDPGVVLASDVTAVSALNASAGCDAGGCENCDGCGSCKSCGNCKSCGGGCQADCCLGGPCCTPTWDFFAEFLYLRPAWDKVSYAVPINGAIVPPDGVAPVQIGTEAVVDEGFEEGFRVGGFRALTDCSSIGVTYTRLETDTNDQIHIAPQFVLRSLVNHPGTTSAPTDFLDAGARYSIDFQLADVDFRKTLTCGPQHAVRYVVGARYARLEQRFNSLFANATTVEGVTTNIQFDGGGIRFGLEGERHAACCGLLLYAKTNASLVGGVFRGRYLQVDSVRGTVVSTGWNEDRVISILDAEAGLGWQSSGGGLRLTAGYTFAAWFSPVTTDAFIRAVQLNNSTNVSDVLTFDGLVARAEVRF